MRNRWLGFGGLVVVTALVLTASSTMAGKGGKKPPKDPPPAADPELAFTEEGKFNAKYLTVANADGSNQSRILEAATGRPSWSHDASQLCFFANINGPGLYTINVDGTGLNLVLATASIALADGGRPAWSPATDADGDYRIAFQKKSGALGNYDIFLVKPDGTGLVNATNSPSVDERRPSWSTGGDRLAVDDGQDVFVYSINAAGTAVDGDPFYLTDAADVPTGPINGYAVKQARWAKTQDVLVVSVEPGGGHLADFWIIDMTGTAPDFTQLTDTADHQEHSASWSPDDADIAYMGADRSTKRNQTFKNTGGYVMASDGSGSTTYLLPDASKVAWRR